MEQLVYVVLSNAEGRELKFPDISCTFSLIEDGEQFTLNIPIERIQEVLGNNRFPVNSIEVYLRGKLVYSRVLFYNPFYLNGDMDLTIRCQLHLT